MLSKKYNCSECLYKTDIKYNFNRHTVIKYSKNNCKKVDNDNKCIKCNKILSSKYYLKKTFNNLQSNNLECHLCHKIFYMHIFYFCHC